MKDLRSFLSFSLLRFPLFFILFFSSAPSFSADPLKPIKLAKIAAKYYAKETCSCLFVTGQQEEFCREILKQKSVKIKYSLEIDYTTKTVSSSILTIFRAKAQWQDLHRGCRLL
ncbi:MAG: hypothetical protein OXB88_06000 [Bacteriovoracales bacterium]|nr:hypothetical protein [Bacteriovoracales bacterium]